MGGPMADWLLKARLPLVVYDIRNNAAAPLLAQGAAWADSAAALAAQCDVVCLCLPGPPEMQAVTLGPRGLLAGLRPGSICIDHTTNSPEVVRQVGAVLKGRQVHLLDAPLDGGREGALEGQLTLFVGGEEAVLQRVRSVLDAFARSVVWVGKLGAGSVTKIVHNALAMSIDLVLTECLTLGARAGVAVPRLIDAFGQGCIVSDNMSFTKRLPATLFRGDFTARFALKLAYKDFRLAAELAAQHEVPTRLLELCRLELLEAMHRGWGDNDRARASTLQEERAGVQLRLPDAAPPGPE
jgi:3-hydroxyisobutyrate dehydrogenase